MIGTIAGFRRTRRRWPHFEQVRYRDIRRNKTATWLGSACRNLAEP